ncbi:MAG TPA: MBOAT family protein [Verrucomicrobia bacterium]|nr:MBOAT family protein [Verrucomicrobiota bacterium]
MLFPTTVFAIFFLVVFTGGWLLIRQRQWWSLFMLLASYIFYGWWDWRFLGLIVFCTVFNHAAALLLVRHPVPAVHRVILWVTVAINLGLLGFFKYYRFFVMSAYSACGQLGIDCSLPFLEIVLPVGISFFTFQAMSYVIDVYRKDIPPADNVIDFATYLAFFPQLVAGPIVRASDFLPQIRRPVDMGRVDTGAAAVLILGGFFKKVVLANMLAKTLVDPVFAYPEDYGALDVLLGVYGYAAQIYCDFSAYSDIAIGAALLLGIRFPANFNAPYVAGSFRDFWRRWHISLSSWLRDYLYIPLGGSRAGNWVTHRNLMLTFLLGGLWHGANWRFVVWGALHGSYLVAERQLGRWLPAYTGSNRLLRALLRMGSILVVFHGVCLSWIFFRAETFADAWQLIVNLADWRPSELASVSAVVLLLGGLAAQVLDGDRMVPAARWFNRQHVVVQGLLAALILTVILGLGPQGVAPFIYFQF